jgi:SAM-dependent methyltransferase
MLDVLEHLSETKSALAEAYRVLRPGGRLVITVPAHPRLWSEADVLLGHARRYTRPALAREIADAGFRTLHSTHVFSWLVPAVWMTRRLARSEQGQLGVSRGTQTFTVPALILARIERALVGRVPLPIGTSILCVAEKPR